MSDSPAAERRSQARRRTFLGGLLRRRDRASTEDCTIRNLSDGGARLEVANAAWTPESFELAVNGRDMIWPARVVWRQGGAIGVRFEAGDAAGAARSEIERLRRDRDRLGERVRQLDG